MNPDELPSVNPSASDLDWELIDRYLAGTCGPSDADRALAQLREHPAAGHVLQQFLQTIEPGDASPTADEKSALRQTLRHEITATATPSLPSYRAMGRHTSQTPRVTRFPMWTRVLAACTLLVAAVFASGVWPTPDAAPQRIYTTNRGERATIQLADGSTVILGAQSKLRYSHPFGDDNRDVYLEGEAYFTVKHQTSKPFVVHTAHSATQVLGTEFLVKAPPGTEDVMVVVTDGKVALRPQTSVAGSGTTLVGGDLAQLDAKGLMTVSRNVPVDTYIGWTRGQLAFNRVTLGKAISDLERWYDITIVLRDSSLANASLSVVLDIESVDQAMNLLADVLNLSWTRSGSEITLTPMERRR